MKILTNHISGKDNERFRTFDVGIRNVTTQHVCKLWKQVKN